MIPLLLAPQLVPASQQDLDPSLIARQRLVLVTCYEPSTGEETLEKWTRATRGDMVSFYRTVRSIYRVGLREWWRQMQYIGDAKSGRLVGADQFGNRYYENLNAEEEIPGRHRWVDLAQHEYNASQVPPEWHSWISHIRNDPPNEDKAMQKYTPPWKSPYMENLTGTRGAYRPYNTVAPKINSWAPRSVQRRNSSGSAASAPS